MTNQINAQNCIFQFMAIMWLFKLAEFWFHFISQCFIKEDMIDILYMVKTVYSNMIWNHQF